MSKHHPSLDAEQAALRERELVDIREYVRTHPDGSDATEFMRILAITASVTGGSPYSDYCTGIAMVAKMRRDTRLPETCHAAVHGKDVVLIMPRHGGDAVVVFSSPPRKHLLVAVIVTTHTTIEEVSDHFKGAAPQLLASCYERGWPDAAGVQALNEEIMRRRFGGDAIVN